MTHRNRIVGALLSTWLMLSNPDRRDERGGSNTIEVLLIIGLSVVVAGILTVAVTSYVRSHLP